MGSFFFDLIVVVDVLLDVSYIMDRVRLMLLSFDGFQDFCDVHVKAHT